MSELNFSYICNRDLCRGRNGEPWCSKWCKHTFRPEYAKNQELVKFVEEHKSILETFFKKFSICDTYDGTIYFEEVDDG